MFFSEMIAEALKKYEHKEANEMETESEDCDITVFDTITSLMGRNITKQIKQRDQGGGNSSQPASSPTHPFKTLINNNSRNFNADSDALDSSKPLLGEEV